MVKWYIDAWFVPLHWNVRMAQIFLSRPAIESEIKKKRKIALISCVKQKKEGIHPAKDLFTSAWFVKAKEFVEQNDFDEWYILSAKYHLVSPTDLIESYPEHLNQFKKQQIESWAQKTAEQIQSQQLSGDQLYILGSEKYRSIISHLPHMEIMEPLKGMGVSKQMAWMQQHVRKEVNQD